VMVHAHVSPCRGQTAQKRCGRSSDDEEGSVRKRREGEDLPAAEDRDGHVEESPGAADRLELVDVDVIDVLLEEVADRRQAHVGASAPCRGEARDASSEVWASLRNGMEG
jgi:hypothetical protein